VFASKTYVRRAAAPQGLPTKIIRLHRSGRQAKAHISMKPKPDNFRRRFPELAEGRCAFSGAWSPLPRWRKLLMTMQLSGCQKERRVALFDNL
jgi:hypothetical protein